jgi:hypothetical protein
MATKKTANATPSSDDALTDELASRFALRLKDSYAATQVKAGWSFSAEMDLLWAAGWPKTVLVHDAPQSDPEGAEALFVGALWDFRTSFSRAAMWGYHRVLRGALDTHGGDLAGAMKAAFSNGTPLSDDEVRAFVAHRAHPAHAATADGRLLPWALASISSAELVVDAALSAAEQWSDAVLNSWGVGSCTLLHELGLILDWLTPAQRARALDRLRALRDRAESIWPYAPHELDSVRELGWHFATLDLLVGGDRAATDRGAQQDGKALPFGLDFVATHSLVADAVTGFATGKRAGIHPRALWLGGEPVLRWYCDHWKKFTGDDEHARFVRVLGEVRSALVTECMLAMSAESKAKKLARQWFDKRSDFARQTLPALTDGPHGARAKKLLDELG